jgi:hypothetical protein
MTLDEMIEAAEKHARKILINEKGAQLIITFLIDSPDELAIIGTPWSNSKQRRQCLELIQFMLKAKKATAYSIVSESWVSTEPKEKHLQSGLMPSQREDRKEIVMIIAVNKKGEKKCRSLNIVRNNDAIIIDLPLDKEMNEGTLGGELANLFT